MYSTRYIGDYIDEMQVGGKVCRVSFRRGICPPPPPLENILPS